MRHINYPILVVFGQKIEKRVNLTVFENFMKWGAPKTDFSECIFGLPRRYYNHFWAFYAWVSQKIHFCPQHAVINKQVLKCCLLKKFQVFQVWFQCVKLVHTKPLFVVFSQYYSQINWMIATSIFLFTDLSSLEAIRATITTEFTTAENTH